MLIEIARYLSQHQLYDCMAEKWLPRRSMPALIAATEVAE
jgi:hypothetical protein